jgi:GT2 family glycosyltransferase
VDVDVVVVTYRSAALLPSCLGPLPAGLPIVVVDNASDDGSAAVGARLGARVVRNTANRGFAAAANQGAAIGSAPIIVFLNPDAHLSPGDLSRLVQPFDNRAVGVAGASLRYDDGRPQQSWWPIPSPGLIWRQAFGLHRLRPLHPDERGDVPSVVGACMAIRRVAFDELGGFDEQFWLYGEETEFCRRARDAGWRVQLVAGAVAVHAGGASGEGMGTLTFEHFHRGAERIVLKHHGRLGLLSHRVGTLVWAAIRVVAFAFHRDQHSRTRNRAHRAMVWRLVRQLLTHPLTLAGDRPG